MASEQAHVYSLPREAFALFKASLFKFPLLNFFHVSHIHDENALIQNTNRANPRRKWGSDQVIMAV